jgi:hypothetical protein
MMITLRSALFSLAVLVPALLGLNRIALARGHAGPLETPAYGILVERVESKSEAELAGFQTGDILLNCTTGEGLNFPVQSPYASLSIPTTGNFHLGNVDTTDCPRFSQ